MLLLPMPSSTGVAQKSANGGMGRRTLHRGGATLLPLALDERDPDGPSDDFLLTAYEFMG